MSLPAQPPPIDNFRTLLRDADPWEQELLRHVVYLQPLSVICEHMHENILVASDGSSPNFIGSFGWILATTRGLKLVEGFGPAFVVKMNSYRSEGYGMMAPTRFIWRFEQFYDIGISKSYRHLCDNQGLVKQIKKKTSQARNHFAAESLTAEWDVVHTIDILMRALPYLPQVEHIESHQDRTTDYNDLPLDTQLNCDADQLADNYFHLPDDQKVHDFSRVPLLPGVNAQIHLPSGTITHHLKRELTLQSKGPPLLKYIKERELWTDATLSNVDWEVHGRAYRSTKEHHTTFSKLIHRLLPVGVRVNRYNKKYPAHCPSCGEPSETEDHFHRCPDASRDKHRKTIITELRKNAEKRNTFPELIEIMGDGLQAYFTAKPRLDCQNYNQKYHRLITEQNDIGWKNFLCGRWTKEW